MVLTHLKNPSQIGSFPQVGMNIKNIWNHLASHQSFTVLLATFCFRIKGFWDYASWIPRETPSKSQAKKGWFEVILKCSVVWWLGFSQSRCRQKNSHKISVAKIGHETVWLLVGGRSFLLEMVSQAKCFERSKNFLKIHLTRNLVKSNQHVDSLLFLQPTCLH